MFCHTVFSIVLRYDGDGVMSFNVEDIGVETDHLYQELDMLDRAAVETGRRVLNAIHKGYETVVLFADIAGQTVSQSLHIAVEAGFMIANMMFTLAQAETITGLMAAKAVLTFTAASLMLMQSWQLASRAQQVDSKVNSVIQLVRLYM